MESHIADLLSTFLLFLVLAFRDTALPIWPQMRHSNPVREATEAGGHVCVLAVAGITCNKGKRRNQRRAEIEK